MNTVNDKANSIKVLTLIGFGVLCIIIGIVLTPSASELYAGMKMLLPYDSYADINVFSILGPHRLGAAYINAGILAIIAVLGFVITDTDIKSVHIASIFMMMGFAFSGKDIINVWPSVIGVFLYAKVKRVPFRGDVVSLAWFSTSLSPIFTTVALFALVGADNVGVTSRVMPVSVILATVIGIISGFIMASIASLLPSRHDGYTLFNAGFASGLTAVLMNAVFKAVGISNQKAFHDYEVVDDGRLIVSVLVLLIYLVVVGLILSKVDFKRMLRLFGALDKSGCNVDSGGYGISLINMGIVGMLCVVYYYIIGTAHVHGPYLAALWTIVGFAANGIMVRSMIPVMFGVFMTGYICGGIEGVIRGGEFVASGMATVGCKQYLICAIYACGLSPVVCVHGYVIGMLSAVIHAFVVSGTGDFQGWLNLYNNGFSIGLVAAFFVPVLSKIRLIMRIKEYED